MRWSIPTGAVLGAMVATGVAACSGVFTEKTDGTTGGGNPSDLAAGRPAGGGGSSGLGEERFAVGAGPFNCPTVPYPVASTASASLSTAFAERCATCHGGRGEGQGAYPKLPGNHDAASFGATVRAGRATKGMPAFSADAIDDATLAKDYAALEAGVAGSDGPASAPPSFAWSDGEVDQHYRDGLAV